MTGDWSNPALGTQRQEAENKGVGFSMGDILTLPAQQRRILTWMMRLQECTLAEVAEYLGEDDQTTRRELNLLVAEGFVEEINIAGLVRYRTQVARKRGSQLPEMIQQALTPGKPLSTIINPSGDFAIAPGSTFELCVTITNEGNQSALIDIFIDETSQPLRQWCVSPYERLALGRGQSSEVIFEIQVPLNTLPDSYNYMLVIDAQQHYPEDTPIQHQARLQVLPFVQEAVRVTDPTFTLLPVTSSTAPALIPPGTALGVQVLVYNRSDRVDRFRLTCPDLARDWFTVIYPEGLPEVGLVRIMDGLELNPGDNGQIQLLLNPPLGTWAGVYSPTVRLYSTNNPDLVLLDTVYLQVAPVYLLDVELVTLVGKVKDQSGLFELQLRNRSNTTRDIILRSKSADGDDTCTYSLTPDRVRLLPESSASVSLLVQPKKKWWGRPFYGRTFTFIVELEDTQQYALVNNRYQGTLLWEGRPWWHFLLVILGIVGLIGALIFLIWWLFFSPKPRPEIIEFSPASSSYSAVNGDVIRLNWQINNPKRLQLLRLQGVSPDGMVISGPLAYDFTKGIPNELKTFCTIQKLLVCKNVPTDARRVGDYVFELTLTPKGRRVTPVTLKTNTIRIDPFPIPTIDELTATQPLPIYDETSAEIADTKTSEAVQTASAENSSPNPNTAPNQNPTPNQKGTQNKKNDRILLNWKISNPEQIRALKLISRDPEGVVNVPEKTYDFTQGFPQDLIEFCDVNDEGLICQNVPTNGRLPGTYIFELKVIPRQGESEGLEPIKTDPLKIEAKPIPIQILEFKVNGSEVGPKAKISQVIDWNKPISLVISWKVKGGKDIKVELLPSPGTVPTEGNVGYDISPEPGTQTITLQVTNAAGEQESRSVTIETFLPPTPEATSEAGIPMLPPGGAAPDALPPPPPDSASTSEPPGGTPSPSPSPSPAASGIKPLKLPPGATPPVPSGASDSPPPAELPPQF